MLHEHYVALIDCTGRYTYLTREGKETSDHAKAARYTARDAIACAEEYVSRHREVVYQICSVRDPEFCVSDGLGWLDRLDEEDQPTAGERLQERLEREAEGDR